MAAVVVSSLVVRVAPPRPGAAGFRLVFEGEIVGASELAGAAVAAVSPVPAGAAVSAGVSVSIAARRGSARARAYGEPGSSKTARFRAESGPLGGSGDYAFCIAYGAEEVYDGEVTVDSVGVGFGIAPRHLVDATSLWFDDAGCSDAPVLTGDFWCAGDAEGVDDVSAVLYFNGRPIAQTGGGWGARSPVAATVVDVVDGPDARHRFRRVQLRFPGVRAFRLGDPRGVFDLSEHPGVYAVRVTQGADPVTRVLFEIDGHGVLRESGRVESRADGTRVLLVGNGRRFGPGPLAPGATLDPVYERWFAARRPADPGALDAMQRWALDRLLSDLARCEEAVDGHPARSRRRVHDLLTRLEELEEVVPARLPVRLGAEELPFESLWRRVLTMAEAADRECVGDSES